MSSRVIRLLAKDFLALRSERWAAVTFLLMMVVIPLLASSPGIATLIVTVFMLSIDEKYHTERFFASLAVKRREIVLARYAGTLVVTAVYFALAFLVNALEIVLGNPFIHPIPLGYCAMLFAAVAMVTAISFPFYFKLGIMKARLVTIMLYFVPVVLSSAIVTLGKGTVPQATLTLLAVPSPGIFAVNALTSCVIAGVALLVLLASIPIAVRLYETRDL